MIIPYGYSSLGPLGFGVSALDYGTRLGASAIGRRLRSAAERKLESMYSNGGGAKRPASWKPNGPQAKRPRTDTFDVSTYNRPTKDVPNDDWYDRYLNYLDEGGFRFNPFTEVGRYVMDPTTRLRSRMRVKSGRRRAKRYTSGRSVRRRRRSIRRLCRSYGFQTI